MDECIRCVYDTIIDRLENPSENSYTKYLFDKGLDKILKKVGEETAEVIIAAKNGQNSHTVDEIADLTYHVLVLMAKQGIKPRDVAEVLNQRHKKAGNLKQFHQTDKNT